MVEIKAQIINRDHEEFLGNPTFPAHIVKGYGQPTPRRIDFSFSMVIKTMNTHAKVLMHVLALIITSANARPFARLS